MLTRNATYIRSQAGFTLIEVLVTLVLLAFALTALVNLQMKLHISEMESYQRGQAVVLIQDIAGRVQSFGIPDPITAANPYVAGSPVGTGDGRDPTADCSAIANLQTRDLCELSQHLKGLGELKDAGTADEKSVGAMLNSQACIEQIQAPSTAPCAAAIYRVTVVWQGLHATRAPDLTCGQNDYDVVPASGDGEPYRRAISTTVTIGLPRCL